jgi:hypothetical protein
MDGSDRDQALQRLTPFLGDWSVEARFTGAAPDDTRASARFEWALGGAFLVQHSTMEHPAAPDGLMVMAPDGDAYTQHYFDSRGVVRIYAMTFDGRTWTLTRETEDFSPLKFAQRYTGSFSDDGATIDGRWEIRHPGGDWELDFELIYTRLP